MNIRNNKLTKSIEDDIRKRYESKKLKDVHIKNFLVNYYEGEPANECPKGCKRKCQLDCYIEIHQALISDDMITSDFKMLYIRDREKHCCGKPVNRIKGRHYCTVCGNEYK